jgi:aryl sulfotransferase
MGSLEKIVWLASYPKSGNTWFRVFISNLLSGSSKPVDINLLNNSPIASSRLTFDEATGLASSDLTREEIENLRPGVYRQLAADAQELLFQKIHDAWYITSSGEPLVPAGISKAVIYFIRNPLDVAVSFAHHSGTTIDKIIRHMADPGYAFCSRDDRLQNQLEQKLFSWSDHVTSWHKKSGLPVKVLRFEDMKKDTIGTFSGALEFIGISHSKEEIEQAIRFSDFSELKKQEEEKGFREKSPKADSFFRKGESGSWRNVLTAEQVQTIVSDHQEVMREFGYLDEHNQLIN